MTQHTSKQNGMRPWRLLNNVFDTLLIAGTGYVVLRLLMMWYEGPVAATTISTLSP
jgi:hypothetical protein